MPLTVLLSLLALPISYVPHPLEALQVEAVFPKTLQTQNNSRLLLPVYVRLQALEKANVTFWESLPQNFSDHVAIIDSKVLAMLLSSNSLSFNLSRDNVGNLWMASSFSLNEGDYISTLVWVSSKTLAENLTPPGSVPFPENYPDSVRVFLEPGIKMPVENRTVQELAASLKQPENMTQTVRNVLDFIARQEYDPEKTRLLLSGDLNTTDIVGFFKDALEVRETNSSMCLERSWYATAILRAAGVPVRTVTDARLKTWIQVWLGEHGWIDAESLCVQPPSRFPRPLSSSTPWMIENSSNAVFPFDWLPKVKMRIANLTFTDEGVFNIQDYKTILSEPIDAELYNEDPAKFNFPIAFDNEIVYAALTRNDSHIAFSIIKGNERSSSVLTLGELNSVSLGDTVVSFRPFSQGNFLTLKDFSVRGIWTIDMRLVIPVVGVPLAFAVFWFYRKRRMRSH